MEIFDTNDTATGDVQKMEVPIFSLHAVAGVPCGGTLQIAVSLGGTKLIALLDSGSTHNFISNNAAPRTGLMVEPRPRLTAIVANGEHITCPSVIQAAPVSIDGTDFNISGVARLTAGGAEPLACGSRRAEPACWQLRCVWLRRVWRGTRIERRKKDLELRVFPIICGLRRGSQVRSGRRTKYNAAPKTVHLLLFLVVGDTMCQWKKIGRDHI